MWQGDILNIFNTYILELISRSNIDKKNINEDEIKLALILLKNR